MEEERRQAVRTLLLEKVEEKEEKQTAEQEMVKEEPKQDIEIKQDTINLQELKKEKLFSSSVIETPNYDLIPEIKKETLEEIKPKAQETNAPNPKFRFRLVSITYCIILLICSVWIISNAVNISKTKSNISDSQSAYNINEAKYAYEISKLDDAQPEEDPSLSPIAPENIFGVQAEKLAEPTDPVKDDNWFNRFCDFISGIFGG